MKKLLIIVFLALLACVTAWPGAGQQAVQGADTETTSSIVIQVTQARPLARLEGLDRLYFQRVGRAGAALNAPPVVASLLPELLRLTGRGAINATSLPEGLSVRDIRLPLASRERDLRIRQIVYADHQRIAKLWWALYDGRRRGDVWYFIPDPSRTENKMLSNYEIVDASQAGNYAVALRIQGSMFRPQGAWWVVGKVLTFSATDAGLLFSHVCNAFGFFQGYDRGDASDTVDISTERAQEAHLEQRTVSAVPEKVLRECKFRDPLTDESWEFSWEELDRVARCVTKRPGATTTFRALDEPSFIERGGRSRE